MTCWIRVLRIGAGALSVEPLPHLLHAVPELPHPSGTASFRCHQVNIVGQREADEHSIVGRCAILQRDPKYLATVRLRDLERGVQVKVQQLLNGSLFDSLPGSQGAQRVGELPVMERWNQQARCAAQEPVLPSNKQKCPLA